VAVAGSVNRSQALVLAFFGLVWVVLGLILLFEPRIYLDTLGASSARAPIAIAFFSAISGLIVVLIVGVLRRWRWVFWIVVVAFLAGFLRALASALELLAWLPAQGPRWYIGLQGLIGALQFAIAVALLRGYRRSGVWGRF
jgi:hypothetical protein